MSVEIGTAYLSIVATTNGIPKQIKAALGEAGNDAKSAGESMGGKLASGIGTSLKVGAVAAATTAGAAMGVALTKGFERLTAIDDAEDKLSGLGHSAQATSKIMDSALASVKGTAFGLGDAATIAASAVAAGVKPGQELTKYLSTTADAASIAGVSLGDMGKVLNQVRTGGSAMTDSLNQMADRGIPIFQWLQKETGLTGAEFKKFVADGKVSAEMFEKVIADNIGGAATESEGSLDNLGAAMGRIGAAALKPSFERLPDTYARLTEMVDDATPAIERFARALDTKVFDEWVPKAQEAWKALSGNATAQGEVSKVRDVLRSVGLAAKDAWPAIKQIGVSLGEASGALGVSGWSLFVTALQAAGGVLNAIVPVLDVLAGVMSSNQGAVTALAAAFLLFKTVPMLLGRVTAATAPLGRGLSAANQYLRNAATNTAAVATANNRYVTSTGQVISATSMVNARMQAAALGMRRLGGNANLTVQQMGRFGNSVAQLGSSVPVIARMQQAFLTSQIAASRFGRTAGTVSAGMAGIATAGRGISNALGGGANIAMMAGFVAIGLLASASQQAKSAQQAYEQAVKNTEKSQVSLNEALRDSRGAMNEQVYDSLAERVANVGAEFEAMEAKMPGGTAKFFDFLTDSPGVETKVDKLEHEAKRGEAARKAIEDLGMSSETMAQRVSGSTVAWLQFRTELAKTGSGGEAAAKQFDIVRAELESARETAERATPGMSELQTAMQTFADSTATATDKSTALKAALDALNPDRTAGEAMTAHNEQMREIAKNTAEAWDQTKGYGDSLGGIRGIIEGTTENGAALSEAIRGIVDSTEAAFTNDADMGKVFADNLESFKLQAQQAGVELSVVEGIADRFGMKDIKLNVAMENAGDVTKELLAVQRGLDHLPPNTPLNIDASQIAGSRELLDQFQFDIKDMPNGRVEISANDLASPVLRAITDQVLAYDGKIGVADLSINSDVFEIKNQEALAQLATLDRTAVSPEAGLVIDQLLQGKAVSMSELDVLNRTTANPKTDMEIAAIMEKIRIINEGLDNAARARTARIDAIVNANPGVSRSMAGGIDDITGSLGFADGGVRPLPSQAQILRTQKTFVTAGEPETGGELYIPLAKSKRERSLALWRKGGELLGVGKHEKFANGGLRVDDLDRLAKGETDGASQPLDGAPYDWAGVNWGDCSGAMSAFARKAAGLDPFGGRFATGNMADALRQMGALSGRGNAGDLRFAWYNGGPQGGHTAGELPSGKAIEMGGGNGGGAYGRGPGINGPSFTDFAHFPASIFGPNWIDPGSDPGGMVIRPDGTLGPIANGNYGTSGTAGQGSSGTAEQSPEQKIASSISENLGNAAKAFVSGHTSDALGVFGMSDSPGALQAISKLQEANPDGFGPKAPPRPSDPGTTLPKEGEDLGGAPQAAAPPAPAAAFTSTGNAVKDAVKRAFASSNWSEGAPWNATDFIVNKESGWDPLARNATSGAFSLFQFLGSTKDQYLPDENPDPFIQGEAGEKYIGDRYGDPEKAKAFWDQEGWYDQGGILPPGNTLVRNGLGKNETALPWTPQELEQKIVAGGGEDHRFALIVNNPTYASEADAWRTHQKHQRRQMMRYSG